MARRLLRVRIRGIYATALTQLALEKGLQVVQASRVIAERFGIPQLNVPADVTLKNSEEDLSELVIVGYTWAVEEVIKILRGELPYSFYWVGWPPLHSTVKAIVTGMEEGVCTARVDGVEATVVGLPVDSCKEGTTIVAGVVKPSVRPGERAKIVPGPRVIGDYAVLYKPLYGAARVSFSEHIRGEEKKAELLGLAAEYVARGYSVHWRSSSRYADAGTLANELKILEQRLREVEEEAAKGDEPVYGVGETVAVVRLSRPDKERLDSMRAKAAPTAPWHHSVKSVAPSLGLLVDFSEKLIEENVEPSKILSGLLALLAEKLVEIRRVEIHHVKPDGSRIRLGSAYVKNVDRGREGLTLIVERRVRSPGIYDGLGVRKEPGDIIVSEIDTSKWVIVHKYYSRSGEYKGSYININTPPEIGLDKIVYLDLEVDIVKRSDGTREVIDVERLVEACRRGIVTEALCEKVREIVREETGYDIGPLNLDKPAGRGDTVSPRSPQG